MFGFNFVISRRGGFRPVHVEQYRVFTEPFVFGLFPAITKLPVAPIFTEITPNDVRLHIYDKMPPLVEYDDVPDFPPVHPPVEPEGEFPLMRGEPADDDPFGELFILEDDEEDFFGNAHGFFPRVHGRIPIPCPPLRARRRRLLLFLPPARGRRPFC
ncbi:hypothetical protein NLI96_g9122 [Meripilus lineatus]|uniref:Uncharacterized protein n=1 Tax=Meripilus lineatus TaxID=2056292 RepID=A0AAD5UYA7_9APHY|nr:hypothetical protein NLI96_g9122 [Physisporinus lineatus]